MRLALASYRFESNTNCRFCYESQKNKNIPVFNFNCIHMPFYGHLLAEVASSLGVRCRAYCISGQIN